jgi:2-methylcitrate dehydratase PrpD
VSKERARAATAELGRWVSALRLPTVSPEVVDRLRLVLLDTFGVIAVGATVPAQHSVRAQWPIPAGNSPIFGANLLSTSDTAAWLNANAMVALELDEGNKYAKGHPTAHVFPAVLALAAELDADGPTTAAALLAGYEVAARFGRATRLAPGAHPHGNWGVTGAAAGCARLLGLDAERTAAAIDTGAGMAIAAHFDSATDGNPVRDAWIAAAATSGLAAARLAAAGVARCTGTAALSLGTLLGEFAPDALTADLGQRWDITLGYFKRHPYCSFTHPAADAILDLGEVSAKEILGVTVETHVLGAGLSSVDYDNRLSAMFSIPFVTAAMLRDGRVDPGDKQLHDPEIRDLARKVEVVRATDLDARLPAERAARVTVELADGTVRRAEAPNPVGDVDHRPLDRAAITALLREWLPGSDFPDRAAATAAGLPELAAVGGALRDLARP